LARVIVRRKPTRSGEGAFGRDPQAAHHADGALQTKKRGSPGLVNPWRAAFLNAI
jgi:hypothetical protein